MAPLQGPPPASQTLTEQSLEAPLGSLPRKPLVACAPDTPLRDALELMRSRRVGSVLVLHPDEQVAGILTYVDVLERVALPQRPLTAPIASVMTTPVHCLSVEHSVHDAAMLMSRHGLRHVPVTDRQRAVNVVSERDLFALQRLSLNQVGGRIRGAADVRALQQAASDIRALAHHLMALGVGARQLTELISHLNDLLTQRLVEIVAPRHRREINQACWLAFGSEGRREQTIATDQDNGLVFISDAPESDRTAWLAFAREVNEALDACGYPLCKGNVMASNPACCLTPAEWCARFDSWIEHGSPDDLLRASIFFDFRPLIGDASVVQPMRDLLQRRAPQVPRFLHQMAQNALRNAVPLNWRGALETTHDGAHQWLDLKLQGAMLFVDAARIYSLAHGIAEANTQRRFDAVAAALNVAPAERDTWINAFEYLQWMRLRVQVGAAAQQSQAHPNRLDVAALNDMDRRILKESVHVARELQQRLRLDYQL
jgi:CBS domain-containing protein